MSSRRLPVYLLLDTSGSMQGEPIHSVNVGLQALISSLRQDPFALETVFISIITFDIEARIFLPLTPLESVQLEEIDVKGATFMGAALEILIKSIKNDLVISSETMKGDWSPLVFLMTDGSPSDIAAYKESAEILKNMKLVKIVACASGPKAKTEFLELLTDNVVKMDSMDSSAFMNFFKWVSASVSAGSSSAGIETNNSLPSPPTEIQIMV